MRKVLLITGELYPINSGAGLHTYGYCNMISKHCEFYACSLYYDEDEAGAERIISKDFNARLVKPYLNKTDKLKNMARIAKANFLFMYPVYKRMHETIVDIIKEKKIDTLIIDHVTMGLYFYKLRKEYPSLRFIYNSHNVEYVNIYDRHIRFLKGDKFKGIRRGINQIRYRLFRKIEKDMLESTFAVFDISKADIDMLKEEYRLSQSRMYLAKPLSSFKAIKTIDSISTFKKKLLIVGSMGWYPNVNGIIWFVEKVFSKIIKEDPEYKLYLVGRGAGKEIRDLASRYPENMLLIGAVPSTDPYFEECDLSIVPVFEGTGAKLKVLESLARQIPMVCSGFAAKDYELKDEAAICDSPEEFMEAIFTLEKQYEQRKKLYLNTTSYMESYYQLNPQIKEVLS